MSRSAARRRRRQAAKAAERGFELSPPEQAAAAKLTRGLLVPGQQTPGPQVSGYDGAAWSPSRGFIYWPQLDTAREAPAGTRRELLRKSRALCENMGLPSHIVHGLADLIGFVMPSAATTDEKWNEDAEENFRERAGTPGIFDAAGKVDVWQYQLHLWSTAFRDGDLLPVLTKTPGNGARVTTYEGHQVRTPEGKMETYGREPAGWRDGVRVGRHGRHIAYSVVGENPEKRTLISARDCIYFGNWRKTGHTRPVTVLRHALNNLQDIGEILRDVKHGNKLRNLVGFAMTAQMGSHSFQENAQRSFTSGLKGVAHDPSGGSGEDVVTDGGSTTTTEKPWEMNWEQAFSGGLIPNLPPGYDIKSLVNADPHPNQLQLLAFLVRDIAWGVDVAPEILWDIEKLRGANNRLLNSKFQRWIGARLLTLSAWMRRYWVYHIACELKAGRLREPTDPQWWKVAFLPQESMTADKGREGKLNLEAVQTRLMSLQSFFALQGKDWVREMKQISAEQKRLKHLGIALGEVAAESDMERVAKEAIEADKEENPETEEEEEES